MSSKRRVRDGPRFFLNPYDDAAFTRCPRCATAPTKVRKVYLAVHVEPRSLNVLNKSCRLCERCDLLIVKQSKLESLLAYAVGRHSPQLIGNDYLVLGTLDRADGRQVKAGDKTPVWAIERTHIFREVLRFEPAPSWVYDPGGKGG